MNEVHVTWRGVEIPAEYIVLSGRFEDWRAGFEAARRLALAPRVFQRNEDIPDDVQTVRTVRRSCGGGVLVRRSRDGRQWFYALGADGSERSENDACRWSQFNDHEFPVTEVIE